jgi:RNA-binding protein
MNDSKEREALISTERIPLDSKERKTLDSKERKTLMSRAQTEKPILHVGKNGCNEQTVTAVKNALTARELIKGRVLETAPESAFDVAVKLAEATDSEVVQTIGNNFVLYKKNVDKVKKPVKLVKRPVKYRGKDESKSRNPHPHAKVRRRDDGDTAPRVGHSGNNTETRGGGRPAVRVKAASKPGKPGGVQGKRSLDGGFRRSGR